VSEWVRKEEREEGSKHQAKYVEREEDGRWTSSGCYRNGRDFWGTRPGKEGATSEGWAGALAAARPSNTRG
jgi:hypothetical protein